MNTDGAEGVEVLLVRVFAVPGPFGPCVCSVRIVSSSKLGRHSFGRPLQRNGFVSIRRDRLTAVFNSPTFIPSYPLIFTFKSPPELMAESRTLRAVIMNAFSYT